MAVTIPESSHHRDARDSRARQPRVKTETETEDFGNGASEKVSIPVCWQKCTKCKRKTSTTSAVPTTTTSTTTTMRRRQHAWITAFRKDGHASKSATRPFHDRSVQVRTTEIKDGLGECQVLPQRHSLSHSLLHCDCSIKSFT